MDSSWLLNIMNNKILYLGKDELKTSCKYGQLLILFYSYHLEINPIPVSLSHDNFRFLLILSVTFDQSVLR